MVSRRTVSPGCLRSASSRAPEKTATHGAGTIDAARSQATTPCGYLLCFKVGKLKTSPCRAAEKGPGAGTVGPAAPSADLALPLIARPKMLMLRRRDIGIILA